MLDIHYFSTAAAFKFSPSLNGESSVMSRDERERRLEQLNKVRDLPLTTSYFIQYFESLEIPYWQRDNWCNTKVRASERVSSESISISIWASTILYYFILLVRDPLVLHLFYLDFLHQVEIWEKFSWDTTPHTQKLDHINSTKLTVHNISQHQRNSFCWMSKMALKSG